MDRNQISRLEEIQLRQAKGEIALVYGNNTSVALVRHNGETIYHCDYWCTDTKCRNAHGNAAGSAVLNARYCVAGTVNSCHNKTCYFNHIRNEWAFIGYRSESDDRDWVKRNVDVIQRQLDCLRSGAKPGHIRYYGKGETPPRSKSAKKQLSKNPLSFAVVASGNRSG